MSAMFLSVPKRSADRSQRGPWWWPLDGRRSATMKCPNGHVACLDDYTIHDDGHVEPSVECPEAGCGFHEYVILEGWAE